MSPAIDNEVREAFLVEAGELLDGLGDQLVALEAQAQDGELLNAVFRAFHTVKGGAGFLALRPMVELCHHAEDLLNEARSGRLQLGSDHIDKLLQALDALQGMMGAVRDGAQPVPAPAELMAALAVNAAAAPVGSPDQVPGAPPNATPDAAGAVGPAPAGGPAPASGDAIDDREFEALLDTIYGKGGVPGMATGGATEAQATPTAPVPPAPPPHAPGPRPAPSVVPPHHGGATQHHAETSVRVDTARIDALVNVVGELVLVRNRFANLTAKGAGAAMERAVATLDRVAGDMQAAVLRMRMQPIGHLFQRFPRIVRDLARRLGKEVVLQQRGEDTDLDRTLVEALADPLVHLLRNAIDHGIETPDARARAGKPRQGTVTLAACQKGERILISVSDDGRGMDPEVLRAKAVEKGLLGTAEAGRLTPAECHALIFRPGFSTRTEISDISGRGVGMDVVKTGVLALGGTIDIESTPGTGTTLRIGIPLTLSIMRVLMVRVGTRALALPLANVTEVFELDRSQLRRLDRRVVIAHRGRPLPLSDLAAWAGAAATADGPAHVVVAQVGYQQLGLVASEVYGREEVMVKPLGAHLQRVPGLAGATIMGDGRVALVLDLQAIAARPLPPLLQVAA